MDVVRSDPLGVSSISEISLTVRGLAASVSLIQGGDEGRVGARPSANEIAAACRGLPQAR
jgi:hypothetical protein